MKKRLLSALLALCMVLTLLPGTAWAAEVVASGECGWNGDNLTWTLDADGTLMISGIGAMGDFRYDANGFVFSRAPWYDYSSQIYTVVIGNGVTSIGQAAFLSCGSLTSVTISNSVITIGDYAFQYCSSLTSVTIPNSVITIGDCAFNNCGNLTRVTIPNSVTSIGNNAFSACTSLTRVAIPNSVITVGDYAFANCYSLTSVTMSNSVTSIGDYAFQGCQRLLSVTIPSSVTSIGLYAFASCSSLTRVTIPDSVTNINTYAFWSCSNLSDVYYDGNKSQWEQISILLGNNSLTSATIHYNSTGPDVYSFSYSLDGGSWDEPDECWLYAEDDTVTITTIEPTKDGYSFKGWSDGSTTYQPGETFTIPDHDVTLTAVWEKDSQSPDGIVDFYPTNGSTFDHTSTSGDARFHITFDREVAKTDGNRPELDFSNGTLQVHKTSDGSVIYEVAESSFTAGTSTDVSLWGSSAPFTAISISGITPKLDYGTEYYVTMPAGFVKLVDGTTSPAINKGDWQFTTSGGQNITYNFSYSLDGGSWDEPDECWPYAKGDIVSITAKKPTKDGYNFKEWSDGSRTYQPSETFTMPDHDVTLTAVWEKVTSQPSSYYLTYNLGGIGPYPATSHLAGETITIPSNEPVDLTNNGYKFGGWTDGTTTYLPGDTFIMPEHDVTLTAIWVAPSLTYDLNGGKGTVPGGVNVEPGDTVNVIIQKPTREGYDFVGWADGDTIYQPGDTFTMPGRDVTLKADWIGHLHTVTYDLNGGTGNIPAKQYRVGEKVVVTSVKPSKNGFTFTNWSDGTTAYTADQFFIMPNKNVELVAVWMERPKAAELFVNEALKYVGYTESEFEKATHEYVADGQWCSDFIGVCAQLVGVAVAIPRTAAGYELSGLIVAKGGKATSTIADGKVVFSSPEIGDIATFSKGHVGIVCDVDDDYVYVVHGNWHSSSPPSQVCAPSGYSNGVKKCSLDSSNCGKWPRSTLYNQGDTIVKFTHPNWAAVESIVAENQQRIDIYNCPIDVSYSYGGEELNSATGQYNASFGNMVVEEGTDRRIIVTLFDNCSADINIVGTGSGTMTLTSIYLKDDEIVDTRIFENVPVAKNMTGKLYAYGSDSAELLTLYSDNEFTEAWVAENNKKVSSADKEATDWYLSEQENGNAETHTPNTYSITVNSSPSTGGRVWIQGADNSSGTYDEGTTVTVMAAANSGYRFVRWMGEDGTTVSTSATYTFDATADQTLTAVFERISTGGGGGGGSSSYQINTSTTSNGTVTVTPTSAKSGTKVTITATPDEGYMVDVITVTRTNGREVEVTDNGDGTYTFTMPSAAVTVTVTFKAVENSIIVSDTENGTVSASYTTAANGVEITLAVTPDEGYAVGTVTITHANGREVEVTNNGDGTYTFTMPSTAVTVTVTFKAAENSITIFSTARGTVTSNAAAAKGSDTVMLTSKANAGYISADPTVKDQDGKTVTVVKNDDSTWSFTMPESNVTVTGNYMTPGQMFSDVDDSKWYRNDLAFAVEHSLISGYNGKFDPSTALTRGMMVTLLYNLEGKPTTPSATFNDVQAGQYYTDAVAWASYNGIVEGYNNNFNPNGVLDRQQMATMLYQYAAYKGYDASGAADLSGYTDAGLIASWALAGIRWANSAGIVTGSNSALNPTGTSDRTQGAAILAKFCRQVVGME